MKFGLVCPALLWFVLLRSQASFAGWHDFDLGPWRSFVLIALTPLLGEVAEYGQLDLLALVTRDGQENDRGHERDGGEIAQN